MRNKIILPFPHLRAACIFARSQKPLFSHAQKSEVLIDTDGTIYGISESFAYRTPPKYAGLLEGDIERPISLSIPLTSLPTWVSSVSIDLPDDITDMQYTLMLGHDCSGNPAEDCWTGIAIRNATDDVLHQPLGTLAAVKKLIAAVEAGEYQPSQAAVGMTTRTLACIIEALGVHSSVLPKEYRPLSMQFFGAKSPIKIDLGAIEGVLITMPASDALIKNSESELE